MARKLAQERKRPNASGRQALKRISAGLHPWRKRNKKSGREDARGRIHHPEERGGGAGNEGDGQEEANDNARGCGDDSAAEAHIDGGCDWESV